MRRFWLLSAIILAVGLALPSRATEHDPSQTELLVQFTRGLNQSDVATLAPVLDGTDGIMRLKGLTHTFQVRAWSPRIRDRVARALDRHATVATVQPNYLYRSQATPNDPQYAKQWHFATVRAPEAWDLDTTAPTLGGDPAIVVAVLDSGLAAGPDFDTARILTGYDFVNTDTNPRDDNGHGTHVTATVAEATNNSVAGAGIAFNSTILPVKVLDAGGLGSTATIAQGITYAKDQGADILNLSLGGTSDDPLLHAAVTEAAKAGVVLVAATGNDGVATLGYPARYDEVIAVGSIRYDRTRPSYGNYGTGIDLVAPGGDLTVDQDNNGDPDGVLQQTCTSGACGAFESYYYVGTSQASPHVAAAAALFLAAGGSAAQTQTVLQQTAQDVGEAGYDTLYGYGVVDIRAALEAVVSDTAAPTATVSINGGGAAAGSTNVILSLTASDASGVASVRLSNDGVTYDAAQTVAASLPWNLADAATGGNASEGAHTVYAVFADTKGNIGAPVTDSIVLDLSGPTDVRITGYRTRARLSTFADGAPVTLLKPYFTLGATDVSGVEGYHIRWTTRSSEDPAEKGDYQTSTSFAPPAKVTLGTWYLLVRAQDSLGNTSAITRFTFRRRAGTLVLTEESATTAQLSRQSITTTDSSRILAALPSRYRRGASLAIGDLDLNGEQEIIVAPTQGREVSVYSGTGRLRSRFYPYSAGFKRGLSVAVGNLDADPALEIVTVPASGATEVTVFDSAGKRVRRFAAFPASYRSGASVAVGDLEADGISEIFVAASARRSDTLVFSAAGELLRTLRPFGNATHGTTVAFGDTEADGTPDLVVASTASGCRIKLMTPEGRAWRTLQGMTDRSASGCAVAVGDVDADGRDELIVSATKPKAVVRILESNGKLVRSIGLSSDLIRAALLTR